MIHFRNVPASLIESVTAAMTYKPKLNWAIGDNIDKTTIPMRGMVIAFADPKVLIDNSNPDNRVTPESMENHIGNRMDRALQHFANGGYMTPPQISLATRNPKYPVFIGDGRHRTAASVRLGETRIPVVVHRSELNKLAARIPLYKSMTGDETHAAPIVTDVSMRTQQRPINESWDDPEDWEHENVGEDHHQDWHRLVNSHDMRDMRKESAVVSDMEDPHAYLSHYHVSGLQGHHIVSAMAYVAGGLGSGDSGSAQINSELIRAHKQGRKPKTRFQLPSDPSDPESHYDTFDLNHMDSALKHNRLHEPLTTYSGLGPRRAADVKDAAKTGRPLFLPAYTSSSTNQVVAMGYANHDDDGDYHVLQIHHPVGSHGLYIGDNQDISPFGHKEHIMPRNSMLRVEKEPVTTHDINGSLVHIWKAEKVLTPEEEN